MKRILFTGFEPFGGEAVNPSWEAVRALPDAVLKRVLPVEYEKSGETLRALIGELGPDLVVCVGQAGGRSAVSIECCALNRDHSEHPDSAGDIRLYRPIDPDGPAARFTELPVAQLVAAVRAAGVPCAPSFHAGTYVCNHVYYRLLSLPVPGLFVHVPYIPAQTVGKSAPALALPDIARALEIIARRSRTTKNFLSSPP